VEAGEGPEDRPAPGYLWCITEEYLIVYGKRGILKNISKKILIILFYYI
jgi:hypothetical protein